MNMALAFEHYLLNGSNLIRGMALNACFFLVPILLIALIFQNRIDSTLKNHQKIKWTIIIGVSVIFSFYLWGYNLWAKWWIIDDHEILRLLGSDGNLPLKEIPGLISHSEIGLFGVYTRFRPSYYFLRFLETFAWGANPFLWYLTRILIFTVSVIILWYLLDIKFGIVAGLIITLSTFSFTFWQDIFSRLGPSEAYAVLGLTVYSLGFIKHIARAQSNSDSKFHYFPDWFFMVAGALIAIGSKENFIILLFPACCLLVREIIKKQFSIALFINSSLILGYGFLIITAILLATSRSGTDIYAQSTSLASRSTILAQYFENAVGLSTLIYGIIIILVLCLLVYRLKGKEFFRKFLRTISRSILAIGVALLFMLTQVVFYNGKWPTQTRYDFPGMLAIPFIIGVIIHTVLKMIRLFKLPPAIYSSFRVVSTCAFIGIIILNGGYSPLVESAIMNYRRTAWLTQYIGDIADRCKENPDVPIVIQSYSPWDHEPIGALMATLVLRGVQNPFYLKLNAYSPQGLEPGLLRTLATILQTLSIKGGNHFGCHVGPISRLPRGQDPYTIDFSGNSNPSPNHLGRIWYGNNLRWSGPLEIDKIGLASLDLQNSNGFGLLEGPYPQWNMARKVRWMESQKASLRFVVRPGAGSNYALKARVLTSATPQRLKILLDGKGILQNKLELPYKWYSLTSKPFRLKEGPHTLSFEASASIRPKGSQRALCVLFDELTFVVSYSN